MRSVLILILIFPCVFKTQAQINPIPEIVIQNDFDFTKNSKPIQYFHDDFVLIQSYEEGQLLLSDGTDANTSILLEFKNFGNIANIQVIDKTAIVFVQSVRDSLLKIYRIQENNINLDATSKMIGGVLDFKIIDSKIYFTELDFTSLPKYSYYCYDINSKTVRSIFKTTKAALSTPISWKNELFYIGSIFGSPGTSLGKYIESSDTLETVTMLDSGYTYQSSKLVIQDTDFFYFFIPFINSNFTDTHEYIVRSDGTQSGTYKLKEIRGPDYFPEREAIIWNNKLYFNGSDLNDTIGQELYVSDGTVKGTKLLKDIAIGSNSFSPGNFYVFEGKLYFCSIFDIAINALLRTDGTQQGTEFIAPEYKFIFGPLNSINDTLIFCGSNDFFFGIGNEIFFYTLDGNYRYFDVYHGTGTFRNSHSYQTIVSPNKVFFTIDDGSGFIRPYVYQRGNIVNNYNVESNDQHLLCYPNPVDDILYFDKKSDLKEISKISLVTENGIEIKINSWNEHKINTNNLLPGFYKILLYSKEKLKYSGSFTKVK